MVGFAGGDETVEIGGGAAEIEVVVDGVRLVGVDVPLGDAGDLAVQAGIGQCVVEGAVGPVEDVGIGVGEAVLGEVGKAAGLEDVEGVLLDVGVEVPEQHDVAVLRPRRLEGEPFLEGRGGEFALLLPAALAVALVGVCPGASAALRLQVVDDRREVLARGSLPESHRQGGAAGVGAVEDVADRALLEEGRVEGLYVRIVELLDGGVQRHRDLARLVDEAHRDGVTAEELALVELGTRPDPVVGAGACAGIELADEVFQRVARVAGLELVLQLGEAENVGPGGDHRGDELGRLAVELGGSVGAARVEADGGLHAAGGAVAVEGAEVVQHVEAADLEAAADIVGGGRAGIGVSEGVVAVVDRPDPVGIGGAVAEHAREARHRVAHPGRGGGGIGRAEAVEAIDRLVLDVESVVVGDRARRDLREIRRVGGGVRLELVGESLRAPSGREADLVKAVEVELLGDGERLGHLHQHALVALEVRLRRGAGADRGGGGQVDQCRGGLEGGGRDRAGLDDLDLGRVGDRDLRLSAELADRAGDPDAVAFLEILQEVAGALIDEHALGGQRVAVLVRGLLLQVEAAEVAAGIGVAGLEVADDDRLHRDGAAGKRARGPRALHGGDQGDVVVEDGAGGHGAGRRERGRHAALAGAGAFQGDGEALGGLRQHVALDRDGDDCRGRARRNGTRDGGRQGRCAGEIGAVRARASEFRRESEAAQRAARALHREGEGGGAGIALGLGNREGAGLEGEGLGVTLGQGGVEGGPSAGLVGGDEERGAGGVAVGGDEGEHLRAEIGRDARQRRHVGDVGRLRRIGDVVDDHAALALQAHEGVGAAVDGADGDALRLGALVVGAVVGGVGDRLVVVEALRRQAREDLLELAPGLAHLGQGAVGLLAEDRDAATAEGMELVDDAVVVGVAGAQQDVEAGIGRVGLERL
ncbi:hypothetical protein CFIICLFH_4070 [Methylobacterium goesingense]|nr:hypothetical protein CFIICLFH_4070 [Methylobacterium goesingense]